MQCPSRIGALVRLARLECFMELGFCFFDSKVLRTRDLTPLERGATPF